MQRKTIKRNRITTKATPNVPPSAPPIDIIAPVVVGAEGGKLGADVGGVKVESGLVVVTTPILW